ncbi:hypothetical protein EG856_00135 [Mycoplasmopsis phocirhinis]|uniref:Endonuclease/exonuclease/phosphatase family protein n=1 Tax=Mycoplasmopsis phocirhinis TaxID=142650 RepID=A0A4P6MQJ9_9BACT|nr:hypothetical protein [Mycoplasmopsis phocirhinis]QBF34349.1 hypothetical protein EG856_00135 [Mycoplasmopsis phocirhinis]
MNKNKLKLILSVPILLTPISVLACNNNQNLNQVSIQLKSNINQITLDELSSYSFELKQNNLKNTKIIILNKELKANGEIEILYQLKNANFTSSIKEYIVASNKIINNNSTQNQMDNDSVIQQKDIENIAINTQESDKIQTIDDERTNTKNSANNTNIINSNENEVANQNKSASQQRQIDSRNFLRLASWNVLNFGQSTVQNFKPKAEAISSIIYTQGYDVIGITELDSELAIQKVVELLKQIDTKHSANNDWKYIISDEYPIAKGHKSQADKYAAFIYKNSIVSPVLLQNNQYYALYDNSNFEPKFGGSLLGYSRPPFSVKFQVNLLDYKNNNFTYLLSHFDGPGVQNGEIKVKGKNGSGEFNEAWNIKNVFEWAKTINNGDDDLIFQGDTNIELSNQNKAFEWVNNYDAKLVFSDSEHFATSLKKSYAQYSQPYDKIIHSSNLQYTNEKIYHLYDFVNDPTVFQFANISSLEQWIEYCNHHSNKKYANETGYIYYGVSDHSPISYDLILDANDVY